MKTFFFKTALFFSLFFTFIGLTQKSNAQGGHILEEVVQPVTGTFNFNLKNYSLADFQFVYTIRNEVTNVEIYRYVGNVLSMHYDPVSGKYIPGYGYAPYNVKLSYPARVIVRLEVVQNRNFVEEIVPRWGTFTVYGNIRNGVPSMSITHNSY